MGVEEPEGNDKNKRREVCQEEIVEGKIEPSRRTLETSLAGTGVETPVQLRLSLRERQRTVGISTAVDGDLEQGNHLSSSCCWGCLLFVVCCLSHIN